jgi:site-specific DNA-methyltransferase (adenine-specific)
MKILPDLTHEEYANLKASIAAIGPQHVLIYDERGDLLDGHARKKIFRELGITKFPVRTISGLSKEEKRHLIYQLNCNRRQLDRKQKQALIENELKNSPDLSNNWIAEILGVDHETVQRTRRRLEATCEIRKLTKFRCRDCKTRRYPTITLEENEQVIERATQALQNLGDTAPPRNMTLNNAERLVREKNYQEALEARIVIPTRKDKIQLYHCDFRDLAIKANSVALVFTDPPYQQEHLPLISDVARKAKEVLRPGGVFLAYTGISYLNEVMARYSEYLDYQWTIALIHKGLAKISFEKNVRMGWRPILIFTNGPYRHHWFINDTFHDKGKEKEYHPYQQSIEAVRYYIEMFTKPNDLVVDFCAGSFTVAEACQRLGRRFIGCDIDQGCVGIGQKRLGMIS